MGCYFVNLASNVSTVTCLLFFGFGFDYSNLAIRLLLKVGLICIGVPPTCMVIGRFLFSRICQAKKDSWQSKFQSMHCLFAHVIISMNQM